MEKKQVLLTKVWDGHQPGEVVEEDAPCADSMVRKGYGIPYRPTRAESTGKAKNKGHVVEIADARPVAETADMTPRAPESAGD